MLKFIELFHFLTYSLPLVFITLTTAFCLQACYDGTWHYILCIVPHPWSVWARAGQPWLVPWIRELARDSGTSWDPGGSTEQSRCAGVQVPCGPGSYWLRHLRIQGALGREGDIHPAGGHGPGPLPGAGSSPWLSLWRLQYAALSLLAPAPHVGGSSCSRTAS